MPRTGNDVFKTGQCVIASGTSHKACCKIDCHGLYGVTQLGKAYPISTGATYEAIVTRAAGKRVIPQATIQRICVVITQQAVVTRARDNVLKACERIIARSARCLKRGKVHCHGLGRASQVGEA